MPDNACSRLLVLGAFALALGGCSTDFSTFSAADLNPLKGRDPLRSEEYNYFYKREQSAVGFVTAADLLGPDGRCASSPLATPDAAVAQVPAAPGPAAAAAAAPPPAAAPVNPRSNQALYFTAGPETGRGANTGPAAGAPPEVRLGPRGIALSMTECQVISVAGYTDRFEIGANAAGERTVTLTYLSGERPGIYRFRGGRLVSMERVEEQAPRKPAKPAKTKTVKRTAQPQQ